MIWIRADGGREIGMGHVMRCLAIGTALKNRGEKICFLLADDSVAAFLEEKGFSYRILSSSYRKMEEELDRLAGILEQEGPGTESAVFLADSYFVTATYVEGVRRRMPVAFLDDMGRTDLLVDLLVNYNIFAEESLYQKGEKLSPRLLLGTRYAPLRQEFSKVPYQVRKQANRVLITTGGSDRYNLAGQILAEALEHSETADMEYDVVDGAFNVHSPYLRELEKRHDNVHIYSNVAKMAELMRRCDMAVTAGGSTMYELSAIGVPIICFSFVDNQEKIVEGFKRRGIVPYGGDYLRQGRSMISEIVNAIGVLRQDSGLRTVYSDKLRQLVDGQGADRIAEKLTGLKHITRMICADGIGMSGRM